MTLESFAQLLQFSISPIALISGASLLLLSITNRFGRTIDLSRSLVRELDSGEATRSRAEHITQLRILQRRSHFLRTAMLFIVLSIFLSALMIMAVALQVFVGWDVKTVVLSCLFLSMFSICAAIVFLFFDISAGLKALHLEVARHLRPDSESARNKG